LRFLCHHVRTQRNDEVPRHYHPEALDNTEEINHNSGEDDKRVTQLVFFPSPMFELQREHRNLSHQEPAAEANHHQKHGHHKRRRLEPVGTRYQQRTPKQGIGWRRQTDEEIIAAAEAAAFEEKTD